VRDVPAARARFLAALQACLRQVLTGGVWHPDLHVGNLLVTHTPDGPAFALTDLYGCRQVGTLSTHQRLAMLSVLNAFRRDLTDAEVHALLAPLVPDGNAAACWEALLDTQIADLAARWRGRRGKLLGGSSFVHREVTDEGCWRWREGLDGRVPAAAVRMHRNVVFNHPDGLLKDDRKRRLSRVAVAGTDYVVKEFRRPGPWGPWSPDRRSWLANWRLEMAGFPVPPYAGWLRDRDGHGYLVMAYLPGLTLDRALQTAGADEARFTALCDAALALIEALYRWGILHQDLKTQNLIVADDPGPPRLGLVDNDFVRFGCRVTPADRARTYRQLRESLPLDPPDLRRRFGLRVALPLTGMTGSVGE
jgi:hypothetical protein